MLGSKAGFKCNFAECTRTYELKQNLTRHINVVHKQSKIKCNLCETKLSSALSMRSHNKKCHKGDNRCKEFVVLLNQRKDKSPKIKDWKVIDKGKIKGEQVCSIKYQQIYNKYI